ncbi:MAG TPA: glycosyltransferase family 2 protein [Chthoniobacterales bacterium]|nr:glycosyltransferase family 2 protein [Chthoniobacterales bacterium]
MKNEARPVKYSLVAPLFNEAGNIPALLAQLRPVMDSLGAPYEVLLVNDGSTDETQRLLDEAAGKWSQLRPIHFANNTGQAGALLHGLREAAGEWILTMDADGQHDPADFRALLAETAHAELVVGIRHPRSDSWLRRAMSQIANKVRARVLGDQVLDSGCGLKVMHRTVVPVLWPLRTLYSFIPAMAVHAGFRVSQVRVKHLPRRHGRSSYGLSVFLWRPAVDMLALWWLFRRTIRMPRRN